MARPRGSRVGGGKQRPEHQGLGHHLVLRAASQARGFEVGGPALRLPSWKDLSQSTVEEEDPDQEAAGNPGANWWLPVAAGKGMAGPKGL